MHLNKRAVQQHYSRLQDIAYIDVYHQLVNGENSQSTRLRCTEFVQRYRCRMAM